MSICVIYCSVVSVKMFHVKVPIIKKIRDRYITNPDFDPTAIRQVSSACEGMCLWVRALEIYDKVWKVVGPKQARLAEADAFVAAQMKALNLKRSALGDIRGQLLSKQAELAAKQAELKVRF